MALMIGKGSAGVKHDMLCLSQPSGAVMITSSKTRLVSEAVVTTTARSLVCSSIDAMEVTFVERWSSVLARAALAIALRTSL